MIYLPKYSVGSIVDLDGGESGKIVSIEANLKSGKTNKGVYKTFYLVEIEGETRKISENHIKDKKEVDPKVIDKLDLFLADSLLLTRHLTPIKIDNTIKELLKVGGEIHEQYESLL